MLEVAVIECTCDSYMDLVTLGTTSFLGLMLEELRVKKYIYPSHRKVLLLKMYLNLLMNTPLLFLASD